MVRIHNVSKRTVVAEGVAVARTFWGRFRGLSRKRVSDARHDSL